MQPETALNEPSLPEMNTSSPATLVNSAAGAAGTLAGWAISSLGKKLAASDMQSTIASSSTPTPPGGLPSPAINGSSLSEQSRTASPAAQHKPPASKSKAMQLGMKSPGGLPSHSLADDLAEEIAASETANPWGTDDLIDVNADEDDWSAFETAPVSTPALQSSTLSTTSKPASFPASRPTPKSPVPQVKVAHASFPGSFDTPISTPSSSRTPEPSWGGNDGDWDAPAQASSLESARKAAGSPSTPFSKEEKAAEMARRKEERRQRIAMLKEQKKGAGK
ncbi:hypothetical protein EST38_g10428 [Candolleomyces aberdarensis]|uniref:Uncharacterized protein n=1 Tax=Candolleomyces aberdarensis TaxID=2316362 RepID=A0A4Q2DAA8_9AGAR|nr:hypothetical protein EST38_g10428 [Candolleomyces aberdarensis]